MLKEAQRMSKHINKNPINDRTILGVATKTMLGSLQFPRANKEWELLNSAAKTWDAWKKLYKKHQGMEYHCKQATGGSTSFSGANVVHQNEGSQ